MMSARAPAPAPEPNQTAAMMAREDSSEDSV